MKVFESDELHYRNPSEFINIAKYKQLLYKYIQIPQELIYESNSSRQYILVNDFNLINLYINLNSHGWNILNR